MMRSQNWRQHLHSQLSKAQKEAVMHKDGPMMVLAGPGSGKTLVITKRIQYLISQLSDPTAADSGHYIYQSSSE